MCNTRTNFFILKVVNIPNDLKKIKLPFNLVTVFAYRDYIRTKTNCTLPILYRK